VRTINNLTGQSTIRRSAAAAALTLAGIFTSACQGEQAKVAPPPPQVFVANIERRDVPIVIELVGQTKGAQDVEIRARVEGFVDSVTFQEGTAVKKGQVLYRIDPKPFEATLANAKADLATWQARYVKTQNDVKRLEPLAAKQAVSQQELDNAKAAQDAATSQVEAAKAAAAKATLDLSYTRVTSPIDGLVGSTLVKPGNLVGRGESTLLTTISQIDPILFRVAATEADYLRLAKRQTPRTGQAPTASGIPLTLADGSTYAHPGRVNLVDRAVDPTTGTLGIQLAYPNPELLVRPGQYGRARLLLETVSGALLVPQRAVQELQSIYSVAIVDASNKVAFRTVKVGQRVGSLWVIQEGVKPGEHVVVEGLQRIQDGMTVVAKPAPAAPSEAGVAGVAGAAQPAGEAK
jgi:membrane fusion protein (multidrug efflux system)